MATQIQKEPAAIAEPTSQEPKPFPVYLVVSVLLVGTSLVFAGKGWYTLYDDSYNARVVGGDAYNFIIYATRGTALVCVGIVCAVLSVTFAVFAHMQKKN